MQGWGGVGGRPGQPALGTRPGTPTSATGRVGPGAPVPWASIRINKQCWDGGWCRGGRAQLVSRCRQDYRGGTQGGSLLALTPPLPAPDPGSSSLPAGPSNIQNRRWHSCQAGGGGELLPAPGERCFLRLVCRRPKTYIPARNPLPLTGASPALCLPGFLPGPPAPWPSVGAGSSHLHGSLFPFIHSAT